MITSIVEDKGDKRRKGHALPKKVRLMIIEILTKKPLQAKDLRNALKKKGKRYDFSKDRLNDYLNQMIESNDIERIMQANNPYPAYVVTDKSKILSEFYGINFKLLVNRNFFEKYGLVKEFGIKDFETLNVDSLIQFFGFYVLQSIILSRTIPKEQRSNWLTPVLDLEKSFPMSAFFEGFVKDDDKKILEVTKELRKKYQQNFGHMSKLFLKTTHKKLKDENIKSLSEIRKAIDEYKK